MTSVERRKVVTSEACYKVYKNYI